MAKRTKYNLEKMPAPLFPASLDKMSDATGARIVDAATGEATIDGVVGEIAVGGGIGVQRRR